MRAIQTVNGRLELGSVKAQLETVKLERSQDILDTGLVQLGSVRNELNNALSRASDSPTQDALTLAVEAFVALKAEVLARTTKDADGKLIPTETLDVIHLVALSIRLSRTPSSTVQEMADGLEAAAQLTRDIRARADALDIMAARAVRMVEEGDFSGISFMHTVVGYMLSYSLSIRDERVRERRRLELALGFAKDSLELI